MLFYVFNAFPIHNQCELFWLVSVIARCFNSCSAATSTRDDVVDDREEQPFICRYSALSFHRCRGIDACKKPHWAILPVPAEIAGSIIDRAVLVLEACSPF